MADIFPSASSFLPSLISSRPDLNHPLSSAAGYFAAKSAWTMLNELERKDAAVVVLGCVAAPPNGYLSSAHTLAVAAADLLASVCVRVLFHAACHPDLPTCNVTGHHRRR